MRPDLADPAPWRLLPPLDQLLDDNDLPGALYPGGGLPRWVERFDSLEALARRIAHLSAAAAADDSDDKRLDPGVRAKLLEASTEAPLNADKAENLRRDDRLRDPAALRVQGPRDDEPVRWPLHPAVSRAVRAASPSPDAPVSGPAVLPGYEIDKDKVILVKKAEVEALINALLRRPLVLLAGVSGSGKTQLAKRIGKAWAVGALHGVRPTGGAHGAEPKTAAEGVERLKAIGLLADGPDGWFKVGEVAELKPADDATLGRRYAFVAVQSDWTEASHLWGYHVPLPAEAEGFYGTDALRVFLHAHQRFVAAPDAEGACPTPHFVLLDEMNLSRPEHFGSDLLSAMEVQHGSDDRAEVISLHRAGAGVRLRGAEAGAEVEVPPRIGWAPGLRVIGTVNVDETTFSFAPKVLDRAALLEFVDVDLGVVFSNGRYKKGDFDAAYRAHGDFLGQLNAVLSPYNLHLAYRAAEEILRALMLAHDASAEKDRQLCHKVLPRVRGARAAVEPLLLNLRETVCRAPLTDAQRGELEAGKPIPAISVAWPASVKKIDQMLLRAYTTGFTSYFG